MIKAKNKKSSLKIASFLIAVSAILILAFIYLNSNTATSTFQSRDVMNFSVQVPSESTVSERFGSVTIDVGEKGEISIGKNGTNFCP